VEGVGNRVVGVAIRRGRSVGTPPASIIGNIICEGLRVVFRAWCLGFQVWGLGLGFRVWGSGFGVESLGLRVWGLGYRG